MDEREPRTPAEALRKMAMELAAMVVAHVAKAGTEAGTEAIQAVIGDMQDEAARLEELEPQALSDEDRAIVGQLWWEVTEGLPLEEALRAHGFAIVRVRS